MFYLTTCLCVWSAAAARDILPNHRDIRESRLMLIFTRHLLLLRLVLPERGGTQCAITQRIERHMASGGQHVRERGEKIATRRIQFCVREVKVHTSTYLLQCA